MFVRRLLLALSCLALGLVSSEPARAQTTSSSSSSGGTANTGTENINSPLPNPERFLFQGGKYVDVTSNPRPQNLNPTGVNFTDCEQDLRMDFSLVISGFSPSDDAHIETWAGYVDCTQPANREGTAGVSQPCWKVAGDTAAQNATSTDALGPTSVYARDVLRYSPPQSVAHVTYDGSFHNGPNGESACHLQTSDAALNLTVYFIPINSGLQALGTAYAWTPTGSNGGWDLVAPPPPTINNVNAGDTLLQIQWTSPGNDPDIAGFAVWSDPPAGGSTTGGCSCGQVPGNGATSYVGGDAAATVGDEKVYQCMEASDDVSLDGTGDDGSTSDASSEGAASDANLEASMSEASMPLEASMPEASMSDASAPEGGAEGGALGDAGAGDGGVGEAGASDGGDAGMINCGGINTGGGGSCLSYNLTGNVFTIGSSTTTTTTDASDDVSVPIPTDDSSTGTGAEGGVTLSGGGIAEINPLYKAGEIDDYTATQLTLTGLTNGLTYKVVVTSIDGSGNVGPPSNPTSCAKPAPTNDYWKTYKQDGGAAGGCALGGGAGAPMFAIGIGLAAAALRRRRRR